ncbi:MAG: hypothetical protein U1E53_20130 [Dongiaceae bacterium]
MPARVQRIAMPAAEAGDDEVDEILAAELAVAGRRPHLDDALEALQHRDVEGAAAEVDDDEIFVLGGILQAVGERRRSAR